MAPSHTVRRLAATLSRLFGAYLPDPFVLAVMLTLITAVAAGLHGASFGDVVAAWQGPRGFWSLLAFTMQMALILVTGHTLAAAPPIARALEAAARWPKSARAAVWLVTFLSIATSLINWGLGLVVGALLARAVGQRARREGLAVHYPLLCAGGYAGLMCWHGGLSGSAPLVMTTRSKVDELLDPSVATLPFTETVLAPLNLLISGGLLLAIPALAAALCPSGDDATQAPDLSSSPRPEEPMDHSN